MIEQLDKLSSELGERLRACGYRLATAESCTGGWLSKVVTDIPGSSAWFDRGFVTYSNPAKEEMLGVSSDSLAVHGAVSEEIALEMARGALRHSQASVAVAITGIAGPDGGTADKPVGTVCFACVAHGRVPAGRRLQFAGDRSEVRHQSVRLALELVLEHLEGSD